MHRSSDRSNRHGDRRRDTDRERDRDRDRGNRERDRDDKRSRSYERENKNYRDIRDGSRDQVRDHSRDDRREIKLEDRRQIFRTEKRDHERKKETPEEEQQIKDERKYIPKQQESIPPPTPTKSEPQEQVIQSLMETKGNLPILIRQRAARKQIVNLYTGTEAEQWVIDEILTCFEMLCSLKAGVQLIYSLTKKMQYMYQEWIAHISTNLKSISKFPPGWALISEIYDKLPDDHKHELAEEFFKSITIDGDDSKNALIIALLQDFACERDLISPLLEISWVDLKSSQCVIAELLRLLDESESDRLFTPYRKVFAGMTQDIDYVHTICAFLEFGSRAVRDQIFASLSSSVRDLALRDPSWVVLATMIVVASQEQLGRIGEQFEQILGSNASIPPYFDTLLGRLMTCLNVKGRLNFINKIYPYVQEKCLHPHFIEQIKYTDVLLRSDS